MNLDGTRPNPGKTRVYTCKSPGLPEKYLDASRPTYAAHDAISPCPRASALLAARNSCSSTRTVPCAAAMRVLRRLRRSAAGTACRWQCGRCGCNVFCFKIVAVLGMDMHFCDPNQLIATKQRNKLAAANKVLCFLPSRADRSKRTSMYHRLL